MELISSSPCSTPFFTAPSSPSSSSSHPSYYHDYEDVDGLWNHRFSLAFDHWGVRSDSPDVELFPCYDHRDDDYDYDDDEEIGYAGDFEFEFNGLRGKDSSASANDLFLEGKIRSLTGVGSSMERDHDGGDRIECGSCPIPSLRVCDILVQGDEEEEEEEDGGDGNSSFETAARDRAATAASTCSFSCLSSMIPGMSSLRISCNRNRNKSWSFKDFLFRSTSEGRGTSKAAELAKGRSPPPEMRGRGRRGRTVSAHELHYRENRMVSEEMRRRTTLPYKHGGFFACLGHGGGRHVSRSVMVSFVERSNRR